MAFTAFPLDHSGIMACLHDMFVWGYPKYSIVCEFRLVYSILKFRQPHHMLM